MIPQSSFKDRVKCFLGEHDYEEMGQVGLFYIEVICKRCNKISMLHLAHNTEQIVRMREKARKAK